MGYEMLFLSTTLLLLSNAITSRRDKSILYSRATTTILLFSAFIVYHYLFMLFLAKGIGVFGGLFYTKVSSHLFLIMCVRTLSLIFVSLLYYAYIFYVHSYSSREFYVKHSKHFRLIVVLLGFASFTYGCELNFIPCCMLVLFILIILSFFLIPKENYYHIPYTLFSLGLFTVIGIYTFTDLAITAEFHMNHSNLSEIDIMIIYTGIARCIVGIWSTKQEISYLYQIKKILYKVLLLLKKNFLYWLAIGITMYVLFIVVIYLYCGCLGIIPNTNTFFSFYIYILTKVILVNSTMSLFSLALCKKPEELLNIIGISVWLPVVLIPSTWFYYFYILSDVIHIKLSLADLISTILTKLEKILCQFKLDIIWIIDDMNKILINSKKVWFYLEQLGFWQLRSLGELLITMRNRPAQLGKFLVKCGNWGLGTAVESTIKNSHPSMRLAFSDICFAFAKAHLEYKNSLKESCFYFIRPIINLSSRPLAMSITPGHTTICPPFSARGSKYFPGVGSIPLIIPSISIEASVKHFVGNVKYFTTKLTLKDLCKYIKNTPNFNNKFPRIYLHIMQADMIHVTTEDYKVEINKIKRTISIHILKHKDKPLSIIYCDKYPSLIYNHKPYIKYENKSLYPFFDYDDKHLNSKLNSQFSKDLLDIGPKYNRDSFYYNWENKIRELLRLTNPSKDDKNLQVSMQRGTSNVDDTIQGDGFASGPPHETVESSYLTWEPSDLTGEPSDLTGEPSNLVWKPSDLTWEPFDLTGEPSDLTWEPFGLTGEPFDLTGEPSDLTGEPSDLTGEPSDLTGEPSDLTGEPSYVNKGKKRRLESEDVNYIKFSTENWSNTDYIILNYDPKFFNKDGLYLREILFKGREYLFNYYGKVMTNKSKIRYAVDNVKLADIYTPDVDNGLELLGVALVEHFKEADIMKSMGLISDVKLFSKRFLYDESEYSDDSRSDYSDEHGSYNTPPVDSTELGQKGLSSYNTPSVDSTELGQKALSDLDPINIRNLYHMLRTKQKGFFIHTYKKTKSIVLACRLRDIQITRDNLEIIDRKEPLNPSIPTLTALMDMHPDFFTYSNNKPSLGSTSVNVLCSKLREFLPEYSSNDVTDEDIHILIKELKSRMQKLFENRKFQNNTSVSCLIKDINFKIIEGVVLDIDVESATIENNTTRLLEKLVYNKPDYIKKEGNEFKLLVTPVIPLCSKLTDFLIKDQVARKDHVMFIKSELVDRKNKLLASRQSLRDRYYSVQLMDLNITYSEGLVREEYTDWATNEFTRIFEILLKQIPTIKGPQVKFNYVEYLITQLDTLIQNWEEKGH